LVIFLIIKEDQIKQRIGNVSNVFFSFYFLFILFYTNLLYCYITLKKFSVKSKRIVFKFYITVYINKLLTLYDNHLMFVR